MQPSPDVYDPSTFDVTNPDTWPPVNLYPDFDPEDPSTWPVAEPTESPTTSPSESEDPEETPSPTPTQEGAELPPEANSNH